MTALTNKISNYLGKPLATIATMAFLFVWMIAALFIEFSIIWQLIFHVLTMMMTLLMVLHLQNAHKHDIHALQARVDALAAELQVVSQPASSKGLGKVELQQVRALLKSTGDDEAPGRHNRDKRPSLF